MPKAQRADQRRTLRELEGLNVGVRLLPAMEDVAAGRVTVSDLRPVDVVDLLGRDPAAPDPSLMASNITGRHVMVTGAGGSIGSELAKQILRQHPARLVLVDMSEAHLHQVGLELQALVDKLGPGSHAEPVVVSILGSILDAPLIRRAIQENRIETIYHAAAFKHVPIVEQNPVVGLQNNTFGTSILADIAAAEGVKTFVLVSTDKAVRPTSVMGASKRLAEIILQVKASERHHRTVFTIVRFGNVLDSSGSVLRRFRTQIESGGPITVTHPDMVRYFMSIPEAAALVIQAGALAEGGDIFVLDMGEPVRIVDLARSMIHLMGREVRDADNPDGDIAITFVGTRAGEKLYEEVALGESTSHPRIWRCMEPFPEKLVLDAALDALQDAMSDGRTEALREALGRAVETYAPNGLQVPRAA
jgi:FlaA1/EpsC-like NDP-sugar epimerase